MAGCPPLLLRSLSLGGQAHGGTASLNEMTDIFISVRDLHTNYLLPVPYRSRTAFLPFQVESYMEDGQRRYIVSKLVPGFTHPTFAPGVALLRWSGTPIDRAVEL